MNGSGQGADASLLYPIGWEKALRRDMITTLADAGVKVLLDVRDHPVSRRPGFSKRQLAAAIEEAGMEYVHSRCARHAARRTRAYRRYRWERFWAIIDDWPGRPEVELVLQCAADIAASEVGCLL